MVITTVYHCFEGLILPFRDLLELPILTLVGKVSFLMTDEASLPFSVALSYCVEFYRSAMGSRDYASRGLFLLLVGLVSLVLGDILGIPLVLFFYMSLVLLVINSDCYSDVCSEGIRAIFLVDLVLDLILESLVEHRHEGVFVPSELGS